MITCVITTVRDPTDTQASLQTILSSLQHQVELAPTFTAAQDHAHCPAVHLIHPAHTPWQKKTKTKKTDRLDPHVITQILNMNRMRCQKFKKAALKKTV